MTRYLLDTNILSDLIRNKGGKSALRIAEIGEANICTSIIAAAELRYGAARKKSLQLTARVESLLDRIEILPWQTPADHQYARLRTSLERYGTLIGANDLLIAAHALALKLCLVTDNVTEFSRVDGLQLENWLR